MFQCEDSPAQEIHRAHRACAFLDLRWIRHAAAVAQAQLLLWDYKAEQRVRQGTLDRPVATFNALLAGPDDKLFGTVVGGDRPEFFATGPQLFAATLPGLKAVNEDGPPR